MNFLRRFYLEREAKRLEERIAEVPDANDFLKLLPILAEMGEKAKVESLRKKARDLYPSVDFDPTRYEKPEDNPSFDLDGDVRLVAEKVEKEPNPWLFGRLARLHVNAGRVEQAEEVAKKAQGLYPNHPYPITLLAEIAVLKNDMRRAQAHFDAALKLDSQSGLSIVHLTHFYNEIKDFERTRKLLEQLLIPQKAPAVPPVPPPPGPPIPGEQPKVMIEQSDETSESGRQAEVSVAGAGSPLTRAVDQIRTLRFLQGVVVCDRDLKVLVCDIPYSLQEADVVKALGNLWHSSMSQSKQMDLGDFNYTAFEGETGGTLIVETPQYLLGLLFDKRRRLDQDGQELYEFCRNLC